MLKRLLDIVASFCGLILLSPLLIIVAIAIKLQDGGSVFYRAKRIGYQGQDLLLYKFRSMVPQADLNGPAVTASGDQRITPIGKFLRNTKLDELPQLINVFFGEMSLVGPRPEDPKYVSQYTLEQRQILLYKPGITSAASLCYRHEESLLTSPDWEIQYLNKVMPDKILIDIKYSSTANILQDITLIIKTIFSMF
jgi:lipopolysaccharide/colanic/teichoic acid biosynthesis glycosyltransferase